LERALHTQTREIAELRGAIDGLTSSIAAIFDQVGGGVNSDRLTNLEERLEGAEKGTARAFGDIQDLFDGYDNHWGHGLVFLAGTL
jgi:hypothetical protein